jgi:hypothetical protein
LVLWAVIFGSLDVHFDPRSKQINKREPGNRPNQPLKS